MPLLVSLFADVSTDLLDGYTARWHECTDAVEARGAFLALLLGLHRANFDLWHREDMARDLRSSDAEIASVKRAIDRINQQRNDLVESIDVYLLDALAAENMPNARAPLHSETPGFILDRLSILSLKKFHTLEQTQRQHVDGAHVARNESRLAILAEQQRDLAACLDALWAEVLHGTRRFHLYRQMKMYNDPELNPVLYRDARLG